MEKLKKKNAKADRKDDEKMDTALGGLHFLNLNVPHKHRRAAYMKYISLCKKKAKRRKRNRERKTHRM